MNEFKVGLLALGTMASLVIMSMKITSTQSGFGDYIEYHTLISDASGIFPKTPIKIAGINSGRIKSITLEGNKAHIKFEVLAKVKVPANSILRIKTVGFLGDKFLEIHMSDETEVLGNGSLIVAKEGAGMENLLKDVEDVMSDVKVIVREMRDAVLPAEGERPLNSIMDDMRAISRSTRELTEGMSEIVAGNKEKLNAVVENFRRFSEDLAFHLNQANKGAAMADLKKILANAEQMSNDMKHIVENINKGKGTIGKFLVEDDIADDIKTTLASVKKIVSRVDSIRTELSMFTGANNELGGDTEATLKIYPSPERFYIFGLATSEFSPELETYTTTSVDSGTESTEIRKVKKKDTFSFNLQVGRKLHNWSFRGGLIESTGGLGIDYDKLAWGSRFSMDVFDYRASIGINLRLSYQVQMWNVLYSKVAFEDVVTDTRSATISAGLKFNDEDLKGLLGFFF